MPRPADDELRAVAHHTNAELARRYGVSTTTIYRWRTSLGLPPAATGPRGRHRDTRSPAELLAANTRTSGDHLIWTGRRHPDRGTPVLSRHGRHLSGRRLAWLVTHGTEPARALHVTCDQPLCVAHLREATPYDSKSYDRAYREANRDAMNDRQRARRRDARILAAITGGAA